MDVAATAAKVNIAPGFAEEFVSTRIPVEKPSVTKLPTSERVIAVAEMAMVAATVCAVELAALDCLRISTPWDWIAILVRGPG